MIWRQTIDTQTDRHMSYGISQFYVAPDRGDVPAATAAKPYIQFVDHGRVKG